MFEKLKLKYSKLKVEYSVNAFTIYGRRLRKLVRPGNERVYEEVLERTIKFGEKALELDKNIGRIPTEARIMIQESLEDLKKIYESVKEIKYESAEEDSLKQIVEKQYTQLRLRIGNTNNNSIAESFIANMIVDQYGIAINRLDKSPEVLEMIYVNNNVPEPLRKVISQYLGGALTKEQATEKLTELESKTKEYVGELGANLDETRRNTATYRVTNNLEEKLR